MFLTKVSYKESIGVRGDRITPTIGDLARVRDFKGLKDLIHKPKTTMILDHAPNAVEILKLGGLNYAEFKNFVYTVEDLFFSLSSSRANKYASYTKDELNIDVQDEYCADIDRGQCLGLMTARSVCLCNVRPIYGFGNTTRLPSDLRPTTRECVHLVRRGHFRSRDKDSGHVPTPLDPP